MYRYFLAAILGCIIGVMCSYVSFKENLRAVAIARSAANSQLLETYRTKAGNWNTVAEMSDFLERYHRWKALYQKEKFLANQLWLKVYLADWISTGVVVGPMIMYAYRSINQLGLKYRLTGS